MRAARWLMPLALLLTLVGCDQTTKRLAETHLAGADPVSLVDGLLDLRYAENRDVAFGALRAIPDAPRQVLMLALVTTLTLVLAGLWVRRQRERRDGAALELAALSAVLAGALGNLVDRVVRGHVVDMIHVPHWPVFNVADACIVLGGAGMLLAARRERLTGSGTE